MVIPGSGVIVVTFAGGYTHVGLMIQILVLSSTPFCLPCHIIQTHCQPRDPSRTSSSEMSPAQDSRQFIEPTTFLSLEAVSGWMLGVPRTLITRNMITFMIYFYLYCHGYDNIHSCDT